ncbi:interferon gamma receptor 1-like [Symphorus nematophorus]
MRLDGAFTALLLLISGASAVIVPPPTNVVVSCQNLTVTVGWKFANQHAQTSFMVNITALTSGHSESYRTGDHQYDLSAFIWKSEERYMDRHYVSVTAIQGGSQSESVNSETFGFNHLKTIGITCKLDFPPVKMKVKDSRATVSFMNPLHFYRELKQADKLDGAFFDYSVASVKNSSHKCITKYCECDIEFPDAKQCVTLNGSLFTEDSGGEVIFRGSHPVCDSEPTVNSEKENRTPQEDPQDSSACSYLQRPADPFRDGQLLDSSSSQDEYRTDNDSADDSVKTECVSMNLEEEEEEQEVELEEGRLLGRHYDRPHAFQVDIGDGEMATAYSKR